LLLGPPVQSQWLPLAAKKEKSRGSHDGSLSRYFDACLSRTLVKEKEPLMAGHVTDFSLKGHSGPSLVLGVVFFG